MSHDHPLSRRDALALLGVGAAGAALGGTWPRGLGAATPGAPAATRLSPFSLVAVVAMMGMGVALGFVGMRAKDRVFRWMGLVAVVTPWVLVGMWALAKVLSSVR